MPRSYFSGGQLAHGWIPISPTILSSKSAPGVDIFIRISPEANPVLFCSATCIPRATDLEKLAERTAHRLFIREDDCSRLQHYLRANWVALIQDDTQPIERRVSLLSSMVRDILNDAFATRDTQRICQAADQLAVESQRLLGSHPVTIQQLSAVLHHDYATFTHSANVAMFALLLAREIGFDETQQHDIVRGALLHDLGKLYVDEKILVKPGRLTPEELKQIHQHPTTGFSLLVDEQDMSLGVLMMVYQHHEQMDGGGYPVGVSGDEIHPYARLCKIVDVFEALTSLRPYRQPLSSDEALEILEQGRGIAFDSDMLSCWMRLLATGEVSTEPSQAIGAAIPEPQGSQAGAGGRQSPWGR